MAKKIFFEKLFFLEEFKDFYGKSKMNYINYETLESRSQTTTVIECIARKFIINYKQSDDVFIVKNLEYSLKKDMLKFIDSMDKRLPVFIDFSSMNLRVFSSILFQLKHSKFPQVFCAYTEPWRYTKAKFQETYGENKDDPFSLYRQFSGIKPLPKFVPSTPDEKMEQKWVVFLGFEGTRAVQLQDNAPADIIPVVTLPSYRPGWSNYTWHANKDIILTPECRKPKYIAATSFLEAYELLDYLTETYPEYYLKISPLGTKINALGIILFVLNHTENVEILYDNPIDNPNMSCKSGKTFIFDITELLL